MTVKNQATHVAVAVNTKPPTAVEKVRAAMGTQAYKKQIENYFNGNRDEAMKFLTASMEYVRKVPKLLECEEQSLLSALVISAQFRFMPSGVSGEGYIIPYGREAKFQLGYQGLVTLLWRTGKVKSIKSVIVYENEKFEYEEGLTTKLIHIPTKFGGTPGKAIGVYSVADTVNGGHVFKVMSYQQVMNIKDMSKAKNTASSPWNSKDPEMWMWKKTCLIQLAKLLPKSQDLQKAIEEDYKGEGLDKPEFDAGGPAVGAALHEPENKIINQEDKKDDKKENPDPETDWMADPGPVDES